MVLQGFQLQLGTVLRFEFKSFITAIVFGQVFVKSGLVIVEKRSMAERLFSIGTSLEIHLEKTEVNPQLNFFLSVPGFELSDHNLAWLVIPFCKERRNV